jgi:hypothetical protein
LSLPGIFAGADDRFATATLFETLFLFAAPRPRRRQIAIVYMTLII